MRLEEAMKSLRIAVLAIGIACMVVFCCVNYSKTMVGDTVVSEWRVGLYASPWVVREVREGPTESTSTASVNVLSWSAFFGVAALASFTAYARLRRGARPGAAAPAADWAANEKPQPGL